MKNEIFYDSTKSEHFKQTSRVHDTSLCSCNDEKTSTYLWRKSLVGHPRGTSTLFAWSEAPAGPGRPTNRFSISFYSSRPRAKPKYRSGAIGSTVRKTSWYWWPFQWLRPRWLRVVEGPGACGGGPGREKTRTRRDSLDNTGNGGTALVKGTLWDPSKTFPDWYDNGTFWA